MQRTMTITTASLALLAGTALPISTALAQEGQENERRLQPQDQQRNQQPETRHRNAPQAKTTLGFYRSSALLGTNIKNANGDTVGDVEDMIVNRGTGQLEYIILSSGGFLGLGDTQVAVPYHAMSFSHAEGRFRLNVSQEQIENANEFKPSEWVALESDSWQQQLASMYRTTVEAIEREVVDPLSERLGDSDRVDLEGTITRVDRSRSNDRVENVTITVRDSDGKTHDVVLGPSWYVMGQNAAPMRGDEVSLSAYPTNRNGSNTIIAHEANIGGDDLMLRDREGTPRWKVTDADRQNASEGARRTPTMPLMLLSDLVGMDAHARDENSGEIQNSVLEVESGRIAMLILDPNEAFLGLGDTLRCVPWPIAAVGSEAVRIDASHDMLTNCEELPDDVSVFVSESRRAPVYRVFQIDVVDFTPRKHRGWSDRGHLGGWSADSEIAKAVENGRGMTISGTVRGMVAASPTDGVSNARAVRVETENGTKTVVLGPEWYLERQNLDLEDGDAVTIDAKRARIGGKDVLVGCELTQGDRTLELWSDGKPMWDAS